MSPQGEDVRPNPGAGDWFALLGEVLLVGLLVTLASLPVITFPAAMVAATRHLRRHVRAEGASFGLAWRDFVHAMPGGLGAGAAAAVAVCLFLADVQVALDTRLPGRELFLALGVVGLALTGIGLLTAIGLWFPGSRWRVIARSVPSRIRADVAGAGYLLAGIVLVIVVTWQLVPLFVPAVGCLALAIVAIPSRRPTFEE